MLKIVHVTIQRALPSLRSKQWRRPPLGTPSCFAVLVAVPRHLDLSRKTWLAAAASIAPTKWTATRRYSTAAPSPQNDTTQQQQAVTTPTTNTPTATLTERWRAQKERFKQKKAQFLLEYGTTFVFLHEILGITSYLTVFSVLYTGLIPVDSILNFLGWTEADLLARGINLHGFFTTWALTVVVVKGLDVLGLVPLRWFLSITLTPRIAWYIGPKLDRLVAWVKRFRKSSPSPSPSPSAKTSPTPTPAEVAAKPPSPPSATTTE